MGGELGRYGSDRPNETRVTAPWEATRHRFSEAELQERAAADDGKYRQWNPYRHEWVEAMPEGGRAEVDARKFGSYSMDPGNPRNNGKWKAWEQLGYDVHDPDARQELSVRMMRYVKYMAKFSPVEEVDKDDPRGPKYKIPMEIEGPPGSNKTGTLRTVWQHPHGADVPRLITNWVEVHKDKDEGRDR